jgi:hypothetical protein
MIGNVLRVGTNGKSSKNVNREFAVATGSHLVAFPARGARWLHHYGGCCSGCRIFVARQPSLATIFRHTSMQKAILESRIQFNTLLKVISEE